MNFRIEPLSDKLGATIYGVDLRHPLSIDEKNRGCPI